MSESTTEQADAQNDASSASEQTTARMTDPRPDLKDTQLWARLFRFAAIKYGDAEEYDQMVGALHGIRACGAVLTLHPKGETYTIEPTLAPFVRVRDEPHRLRTVSQWETREQYNEDRKVLLPYVEQIKWLLKALAGYGKLPASQT